MLAKNYKGLILVLAISAITYMIQKLDFIQQLNISSLLVAILLGTLVKNTFSLPVAFNGGIDFCSKRVLRLAVIFMGFRMSLTDIGAMGVQVIALILLISGLTLWFTKYVGGKLGIPWKLIALLGCGTSICGAAAIAAVNSVIKGDDEDVAYSIGVITLFGTLFMFLYPLSFLIFKMNELVYLLWVGTSIHEVAQVVAAGFAISQDVGAEATIVKLIRVLLIIPVTLLLVYNSNPIGDETKPNWRGITIPWFVIVFLAVVVINSYVGMPHEVRKILIDIDGWLMMVSMAALGLGIKLDDVRKMGVRPLFLGLVSSVFISGFSMLAIIAFRGL